MLRPSLFTRFTAMLLALLVSLQPAAAQSILRDAETEAFFAEMSADIIQAAGLQPRHVQIVLINDKEINAFVAGGQIVYVHSGLITAAKNVNEVQGVVAHELGHVVGGHVIRINEGAKAATGISILSLLLGAAAIAAGAGDAGAGCRDGVSPRPNTGGMDVASHADRGAADAGLCSGRDGAF